jgi:glycerol-3-phosphate dehydrogenase
MGLGSFNKQSRQGLFRILSGGTLDLLVIGGGITGASVFRDAALRGMSVALVEANDFASATSGRSSKLIHGGLRYLKNLGFRLAWESCHERNLHVRLNKRLVRPMPFLVPLYRGQGEPRALMRLGMVLYEGLSGFHNYRLHRFMSREETLSLAPALPVDGLTGGCLYYDAVVSDNRWTVETVKDGVRHGGVAVNHAPLTGLLREGGKVIGGRIQDNVGGGHYEVRARAVVNATGPRRSTSARSFWPSTRAASSTEPRTTGKSPILARQYPLSQMSITCWQPWIVSCPKRGWMAKRCGSSTVAFARFYFPGTAI